MVAKGGGQGVGSPFSIFILCFLVGMADTGAGVFPPNVNVHAYAQPNINGPTTNATNATPEVVEPITQLYNPTILDKSPAPYTPSSVGLPGSLSSIGRRNPTIRNNNNKHHLTKVERITPSLGPIINSPSPDIDQAMNLRIFFMRHSKSCSNMLRENDTATGFRLKDVSQKIRDAPLSEKGVEMARAYKDKLTTVLSSIGILTPETYIGASELTRAQQTARLLFPAADERTLHIVPYLSEKGDIPENTRREARDGEYKESEEERIEGPIESHRSLKQEPNWNKFKGWLREQSALKQGTAIIVGHGAYLSNVLEELGSPGIKLKNMDGFVVRIEGDKYTLEKGPPNPDDGMYRFTIGFSIKASNLTAAPDKCSARSRGDYKPFPLNEYTTDPAILKYKSQLDYIFKQIMRDAELPTDLYMGIYIEFLQDNYKKVLTYLTDPILKAMFIKIYLLTTYAEEWPPLDYPESAPLLYKIPGYMFEAEKHFCMRILSKFESSPEDGFDFLKMKERGVSNQSTIMSRMKLKFPDIDEKYNSWINSRGTDKLTLLSSVNTLVRFIERLNRYDTWDDLLNYLNRQEFFTEFFCSFTTVLLKKSILARKLTDRYQQMYVIVPSRETDILRRFSTIDAQEIHDAHNMPLSFNDTRWIKFAYPFPEEPALRDGIYKTAMVIQGYRLRAHPDIVAALRRGPPVDAHPDVKRMFPEWWASDGERKLWVDDIGLTGNDEQLPYNLDYIESIQRPTEAYIELVGPEFSERYDQNKVYADLRRALNRKLLEKAGVKPTNEAFNTMPPAVKERAIKLITHEDINQIIDEIRRQYISTGEEGATKAIRSDPVRTTLARLEQLSRNPKTSLESVVKRLRTWRNLYSSSSLPATLIRPILELLEKIQAALPTLTSADLLRKGEADYKKEISDTVTPIYWALEGMAVFIQPADGISMKTYQRLVPESIAEAALRYLRSMETTKGAFDDIQTVNGRKTQKELKLFMDALEDKSRIIKIFYKKFTEVPENEEYDTRSDELDKELQAIEPPILIKSIQKTYRRNQIPENEKPGLNLLTKPSGSPSGSEYNLENPQFVENESNLRIKELLKKPIYPPNYPPRYIKLKGGAYETPEQKRYIEIAQQILRLYYSPLIPVMTSVTTSVTTPVMTSGATTEQTDQTTEAKNLDILANLADIDPQSVCKKILETPKYKDLETLLNIKEERGWFGGKTIKCPKTGALESVIKSYKEGRYKNGQLDILERFLVYAKNPKVTDEKVFKKFMTFKPEFLKLLPGEKQRLDSIQTTNGLFRTSYPSRKMIIDLVEPMLFELKGAPSYPLINDKNDLDYLNQVYELAGKSPKEACKALLATTRFETLRTELGITKKSGWFSDTLTCPPTTTIQAAITAYIKRTYRQPKATGGARRKTAAIRRMGKARTQKGGGVTMPLGFYQEGAQMQGTYGSETGAGLGVMTANMARSALTQTGGRKAQSGGFSPSIMGSFAANGLSLLPVASYMGYKMMNKKSKTRKDRAARTGRKRQTRRQ
jgi:broad specificity phosphatase PhoE